MLNRIGIRREDKNRWEARVPLVPEDVKTLITQVPDLEIVLQPSRQRAFNDEEYAAAGALVADDLSTCRVILAVKEIPVNLLEPGKVYIFFSHTIKGQPQNMPILKKLIEVKGSLIDYERIVDEKERRLIFFGRHAGLAGMIDTLWALGQRLKSEGFSTPLEEIGPAHVYGSMEKAIPVLQRVAGELQIRGLPKGLGPLVVGFAGYGNVSRGAQAVFDILPHTTVTPEDLPALPSVATPLVKVVFEEHHMVEPRSPGGSFELQDYFKHPEKYHSRFDRFLPHLHVLVNAILWDQRYPRLVTKDDLRALFAGARPRPRVIGDITCDREGSIEATVRFTTPDNPVYVYDPETGDTTDGVAGRGPVILAVDNLPCEIPQESSRDFSKSLIMFIPSLAQADFTTDLDALQIPEPFRRALIVYRGELTPQYTYLQQYLAED
jgi:alpha-aminoadipic semialdehyde synthase